MTVDANATKAREKAQSSSICSNSHRLKRKWMMICGKSWTAPKCNERKSQFSQAIRKKKKKTWTDYPDLRRRPGFVLSFISRNWLHYVIQYIFIDIRRIYLCQATNNDKKSLIDVSCRSRGRKSVNKPQVSRLVKTLAFASIGESTKNSTWTSGRCGCRRERVKRTGRGCAREAANTVRQENLGSVWRYLVLY